MLLCADAWRHAPGHYVGHDEPSVLFKSKIPDSGNNMTYTMTLPRDPKVQPNATGKGGTTWSSQLRPTFWFGLALCDTESAPEFTKTCKPDSDSNNLVGKNPKAANNIGKHPGTAFMELQFGGSSKTEFGHLLFTLFPNSNGKPALIANNFNSGAIKNPCQA